jgi:hypothetical protein
MASSYSDLGLELMVTGENAGTWGDKTNSNLNLIQQSVAGYEAITLTSGGTVNLAMTDAALSTARNMIIKFATATIAASTICTIPDGIEKFYIFDCSGLTDANNLTIKTVSGTGFSPTTAGAASPKMFAAYSDGTNLVEVSLNTLGGTIATAQIEAAAITTALLSDNAVTTAKISDNQVTTAKISDNQITTAKISDNQVTTAKIADDAVGPDQLSNTAVTPAEYTSATITVDAQGRITAASSGSAGAGGFVPQAIRNGPSSGTHTFNPGTNYVLTYLYGAGGGGGGGKSPGNPSPANANRGGTGGDGGFGGYFGPTGGAPSKTFNIGGGGNGGNVSSPGNPGNTGGSTTFTDFGTVNGGGGGSGGEFNGGAAPTGSAGSAPGATVTYSPGNIFVGGNSAFGAGGGGGPGTGAGSAGPGSTGSGGTIFIFENFGS